MSDGSFLIDGTADGALAGMLGIIWFVSFAIAILNVIAMWKVFVKAGKPGWAAIVPIYNVIIYLNICGFSGWCIFLCMLPIVNIVMVIMMALKLAKAFGQSSAFAVGLIFINFIFMCILGFGKAEYVGLDESK